jgi:RNA polymerase sigma-70 factor (ECF subfamily)
VEVAVVTGRGVDVGRLVTARVGDAYRLARAILLDDGEAEDAVQEASLTAWRKQGSLREASSFGAWFDRILINECRDRLRKRRRSVQLAPSEVSLEVPAAIADGGADPDVDRALAALDVDHRIVVVMRYWQDRTVDDIAARIGIPSGTVKSRLHNALRAMRVSLEASYGRS